MFILDRSPHIYINKTQVKHSEIKIYTCRIHVTRITSEKICINEMSRNWGKYCVSFGREEYNTILMLSDTSSNCSQN